METFGLLMLAGFVKGAVGDQGRRCVSGDVSEWACRAQLFHVRPGVAADQCGDGEGRSICMAPPGRARSLGPLMVMTA
jgi:hypothetical protein